MFRVCHVLITVLGMILCPFGCAGELGRASASRDLEVRQPPSCSCCQHGTDSGEQKSSRGGPAGRGSPSGCGCTCLCKGALPGEHGAAAPAPDETLGLAFAPAVDLSDTLWMQAAASWLWGGPPGGYPAGRAARLVYQSLLC